MGNNCDETITFEIVAIEATRRKYYSSIKKVLVTKSNIRIIVCVYKNFYNGNYIKYYHCDKSTSVDLF